MAHLVVVMCLPIEQLMELAFGLDFIVKVTTDFTRFSLAVI